VIYRDAPSKFLIIIFFLFCLSNANSEVYKWIDENGKVVYGDKPTSSDAEQIKIKKTPVQDPLVQERYEKQNKLLDIMKQERDEKNALKKEEKQKKDEQKKMCANARQELKKIKEARYLYEDSDDPNNPRIWTDKERKATEIEFENYIKKNC